MIITLRHLAILVLAVGLSQSVSAHFPWLTVSDDGKPVYFFGETQADRTYKMPASMSKAVVHTISSDGGTKTLDLVAVDSDELVGMKAESEIKPGCILTSTCTYGIYHGSKLQYYSQHITGKLSTERSVNADVARQLKLHADLVDTEEGVEVTVFWNGEVIPDASVSLYCSKGHEEASEKTNAKGKVLFNDREVEDGLNGIVVGYVASDQSGELDGQAYGSTSHYLTATFVDPEDFAAESRSAEVSVSSDAYPTIPARVTSFGAAVAGDSLFIYGGHTGEAHHYYSEAQANTLYRLNLSNPKQWEDLGQGPRLQGLAMVQHDGCLYRLGGFTAMNKQGDDQDLRSQAGVAKYDIASGKWSDLAAMPEPRSSFDAAVLDSTIYVIGGWSMNGDEDSKWHKTAYCLDLTSRDAAWTALPEPPFARRALSVAAHNGKIYAIGGMQEVGGPTTRVDCFDTKSGTWEQGPSLLGKGMDGFGSSSFATGGNLYVTTYSGALQCLSDAGDKWETIHQLERERFFHRMLPMDGSKLISVGGASMESGKFEKLDVISIH